MKRFGYLAVLMALSSSAHADGISFVVHGQRVHIEAPRDCRSLKCVSVSIPGFHLRRDDDDDDQAAPVPVPARPALAGLPATPAPVAPISAPPAPVATGSVASPAPAAPAVPVVSTVGLATAQAIPAPPKPEPVASPSAATAPAVSPAPPATTEVAERAEHDSNDLNGPLGDWRPADDGSMVRIEPCGSALCGHIINPGSNTRGETVLVNMKPKNSGTQWSGSIISRASGESYYATITMTGQDVARVEACALGRFFCTGKDWTREPLQRQLRVSRQASAE
jgi:uncharacterized protein (DUF2147 family)